jgi:hypothetical protein
MTTTHAHTTSDSSTLIRTGKAGSFLTRILADWDNLASRPRVIRQANAWGLPGEPVTHLNELMVRAGFGRPVTCDESDLYLSRLVRIAAHDPLAAQVVLHRLLPPLIDIAKRRGKFTPEGIEGAITNVFARAWIVICSFPSDRRPRKIASNIVRDVEYWEYVAPFRRRDAEIQFFSPEFLNDASPLCTAPSHDGVADDPERELFLDLAMRGTPELRIQILHLVCDGLTSLQIAEKLKMRPRTVRWQRAEVTREARNAFDGLPADTELADAAVSRGRVNAAVSRGRVNAAVSRGEAEGC